jgi:hypothetical protein
MAYPPTAVDQRPSALARRHGFARQGIVGEVLAAQAVLAGFEQKGRQRQSVLELRAQGLTFKKIGELLGVTNQRAHQSIDSIWRGGNDVEAVQAILDPWER